MRTAAAVTGMVVAFGLALCTVGLFAWAAGLDSIITDDGDYPFEGAAFVLIVASWATGFAAVRLWKAARHLRWPDDDSDDAAATALVGLWVLGVVALALFAVLVVLRLTGVVGPVLTDKGL